MHLHQLIKTFYHPDQLGLKRNKESFFKNQANAILFCDIPVPYLISSDKNNQQTSNVYGFVMTF